MRHCETQNQPLQHARGLSTSQADGVEDFTDLRDRCPKFPNRILPLEAEWLDPGKTRQVCGWGETKESLFTDVPIPEHGEEVREHR